MDGSKVGDRALLEAKLAQWQAERTPHDETEFRRRLDRLVAEARDVELQEAVWDYKERAISREELLRHPAHLRIVLARISAGLASVGDEQWAELEAIREESPDDDDQSAALGLRGSR